MLYKNHFAGDDPEVALHLTSGTLNAPRHAPAGSVNKPQKRHKTALVSESIHFPFTHDLHILRDLLPEGQTVRDTQ